MPFYPDWTIVTACIPGCSSRISWDYDDGEPMTRDYPGYPPEIFPAQGCTEQHLMELGQVMGPEIASIHHDAWQRVADYDRWIEASRLSRISSLQYIAGPGAVVTLDNFTWIGRRRFRLPLRPVWDHDDEDE